MSRYQFSAIMMLLWGILGQLTKPSTYSTGAHLISLLYAIGAAVALWKSRKGVTP